MFYIKLRVGRSLRIANVLLRKTGRWSSQYAYKSCLYEYNEERVHERIRNDSYQDGFDSGFDSGFEAGVEHKKERVKAAENLLAKYQARFGQLPDDV